MILLKVRPCDGDACGVTPQAVVMKAKPDLGITRTPGHMFISDPLNEKLAIL